MIYDNKIILYIVTFNKCKYKNVTKKNNLIYCYIFINVSIKMLLKSKNMIYCNILNKCKYKNVTKDNKSCSVKDFINTFAS